MAIARELKDEDRQIVAIIGDGAMSAGMAYETMNNAGTNKVNTVVVLNDNGMSIAPPVGPIDGHDPDHPLPVLRNLHATDCKRPILHVVLQSIPVRFARDRAGLVGAGGATYAGAFDIIYLGCLPNMVLMVAADELELMQMVATAPLVHRGGCALRQAARRGARRAAGARTRRTRDGRGGRCRWILLARDAAPCMARHAGRRTEVSPDDAARPAYRPQQPTEAVRRGWTQRTTHRPAGPDNLIPGAFSSRNG